MPADTRHLQDRIAVVTGAGQGIGQAIAGRFAREGAHVVIDELHVLIGTERGRQLQCLLHRGEAHLNRRVPRVGLSATLGDIDLAAEHLLDIQHLDDARRLWRTRCTNARSGGTWCAFPISAMSAASCLLLADFNICNLAGYMRNDGEAPAVEIIAAPYDQVVPVLADPAHACWDGPVRYAVGWTRPERVSPTFAGMLRGGWRLQRS